ncbi:hypothetical protein FQZ97_800400 [compost metagenome]
MRRVFHLVKQLRGAAQPVHAPTGAWQLGDDRAAIGRDFGERETHAVQIGHVHMAGIGQITPTDLRRAFEQVPHQQTLTQVMPVVRSPAEVGHERRHKERRVGHAAGNDHVHIGLQRGQQGVGAEVGVGRDQAAVQRTHGVG